MELNKHERSVIHGTLQKSSLSAPPTPFFQLMKRPQCLSWTSGSSPPPTPPPHHHTVLPRDSIPFVLFCIFCCELPEIRQTGGTTRRCEREFVYVEETSYPVFGRAAVQNQGLRSGVGVSRMNLLSTWQRSCSNSFFSSEPQ